METDGFQADTEEDEEDDCVCISAKSGELIGTLTQARKWWMEDLYTDGLQVLLKWHFIYTWAFMKTKWKIILLTWSSKIDKEAYQKHVNKWTTEDLKTA